jgi:hypothetical protein
MVLHVLWLKKGTSNGCRGEILLQEVNVGLGERDKADVQQES